MSRFADPSATAPVDLGACQCPGTPHEHDEAIVRWQLSGSALARVGAAQTMGQLLGDPMQGYRQLAREALVSWTLLADDGEAAPITDATVEALDAATLTAIAEKADALVDSKGTLPNASGAPSPASPRGSASQAPTRTPRRGT